MQYRIINNKTPNDITLNSYYKQNINLNKMAQNPC